MNNISECPARAAAAQVITSAAEAFSDAKSLSGAAVFITGATGFIGGTAVRTLLYLNRVHDLGLRLICPVRSMERAKSALDGVFNRRELNIFEADITALPEIYGPVDYIIHTAAPTASGFLVNHPATVIDTIVTGTRSMLEFAREKQVKRMVNLSSMEAFGAVTDSKEPRTENELGSIDLTSVRSCYSEGKRLAELMCTCYAAEFGTDVCSLRLAQTFGAGVKDTDRRVFMQFVRAALDKKELVLHTEGRSMGNYIHIADCVSAILHLLVHGQKGETYSAAGDNCYMTIKQLAEATNRLLNPGGRVVIDIPADAAKLGYAPDTLLVIDNSKLKSTGWQPKYSLDDMIISLAADIGRQV